jgi:two-component system, chemotaxis family, sensor kinase CheA
MSGDNPQVTDEFFADMLPDFLDEANENINRLNEHLLKLDEQVKAADGAEGFDAGLLNDMFRAAHTLKGLSGMLNLRHINALTHKVENVFDAARNSELPITAKVVEVVFQSLDRLGEMLERLKDGQNDDVDCELVIEDIQSLLKQSGVEKKQASQQEAEESMRQLFSAVAPAAGSIEEAVPEAAQTIEPVTQPVAALPAQTVDIFASIQDDVDLSSKYISIFLDEAELTLDQLTESLLNGADDNVTEHVLVLCHRMKGSAATVGLNRAAKLAHYMEDLLQVLRENGSQLTVPMTDAMLDCAEVLRVYVGELKKGESRTDCFSDAYHKLIRSQVDNANTTKSAALPQQSESRSAAIAETSTLPRAAADVPSPSPATASTTQALAPWPELTDAACSRIAAAAPAGQQCCVGQIVFRDGLPDVGLKARLLYEKFLRVGEIFYCDPPESTLDDAEHLRAIVFGLSTESAAESLRPKLTVEGATRVELRDWNDSAVRDDLPASTPEGTSPATSILHDGKVIAGSSVNSAAVRPTSAVTSAAASNPTAKVPASKEAGDKTDSSSKPAETVRVDIERLDQLMNLAGQLVINRARFAQISTGLRRLLTGKQNNAVSSILGSLRRLDGELDNCEQGRNTAAKLEDMRSYTRRIQTEMETVQRHMGQFDQVRSSINELLEAVHQLDRVSDGIQKCVMDTRMVPIGPLFTRFKRVVRDISRSNGKEIRLVIHGENTELDKRMIDELGDPLIHIIRNSADHGVELPEVRVAAGKPAEGTITLDAMHRGNSIVIQIKDDGKGLDSAKIRNKAVQKGLMSQADADALTDQQAYQLIWEAGLSTAEKITEVSGRGMGMDIVRSKIQDINGTVELDSRPGEGTTITIKLPLTLAILPSLLAEIDGDVFAVPVETVSEIVRVAKKDISRVHGLDTAVVRGRVVSVVQLPQLFEWRQPPCIRASKKQSDERTLVIVESDGQEIGLVVDKLIGEEDIVIKSLAENYHNVPGVAGASILGDGRVSLILDVGALVERSSLVSEPASRA